jgi:hypothetical protein
MKEKKSSKHSSKEFRSEHKHKKKQSDDRHHHSKSKHKKHHKDKKDSKGKRHVDMMISPDDYFVRNEEFRVWLKLDRRRYNILCDFIIIWFIYYVVDHLRSWTLLTLTNTLKNSVRSGMMENWLRCIIRVIFVSLHSAIERSNVRNSA